jgi:hypothetical protein
MSQPWTPVSHLFPIYRHGEPAANHMRTQIVEKGPKWSMAGRQTEACCTDDTPIPGCAPRDGGRFKYRTSPSYSFGGHSESRRRPSSAPPGGRRRDHDYQQCPDSGGAPRATSKPMTRQNSFGSSQRSFGTGQRKLPWGSSAPDLGPGPGDYRVPARESGLRFSLGGRIEGASQSDFGPGPAFYNPASTQGVCKGGPRYRRSHARPSSAGSNASSGHPGPMYNPKLLGRGPSFSLGASRTEKRDAQEDAFRPLPPPFTHFGYDDFGRSMGIE